MAGAEALAVSSCGGGEAQEGAGVIADPSTHCQSVSPHCGVSHTLFSAQPYPGADLAA